MFALAGSLAIVVKNSEDADLFLVNGIQYMTCMKMPS